MIARDYCSAMPQSVASSVDLEARIFSIRGFSVLLDTDLAALYGVTPGALMQAVRRNADRFPDDFMFQLTDQEVKVLKSQTVISKPRVGRGGRRARPYAFTEQGVAMLSSILRSETAVRVNIEIMRTFVRLRRAAVFSSEVTKLVDELSMKVDSHDQAIGELISTIRRIMEIPTPPERRKIGFV